MGAACGAVHSPGRGLFVAAHGSLARLRRMSSSALIDVVLEDATMVNRSAILAASCIVSASFALVPISSQAQQQFDNAATHQQARYGGKICMVTHHHYGESPSWPSKRGAQRAAIRKWESFTEWEYGPKWGSYALARGKSMKCNESGGRWICSTIAYPCRRG